MNRMTILMYHIIDEPRSAREAKYCCTPKRFAQQMRYLRESGRPVVSLDTLADCLEGGKPCPDDAVAVTFDDGFSCTCENALPVLLQHRIPATMFIVSDRIDGTNDWMYRRGFPEREILSKRQLFDLKAAGICLGSHTRTHPRLTNIEADKVLEEVQISKRILEDILAQPVDYFAYPYGLYNEDVRSAVVSAGYRAACSTRSGFNRADVDRFALRRIEVYGSDSLWTFRQKLKFGTNDMSLLFPLRYYGSRIAARLGLV